MKNSKKTILLLSSLAALALTGCGSQTTTTDSVAAPASEADAESTAAVAAYTITDDASDHVVAVGLPATAEEGDTITFSLAAVEGYETTGALPVVTSNGADVPVTANDDGTYTFVMPAGNVTISETAQVAKYGIENEIGGTLKYTAYKKLTMKDVYQEAFQNVAGTYEGELAYSTYGSYNFRLYLYGDGTFKIARYSSYSSAEDSTYEGSGNFQVQTLQDAEGNDYTDITGSTTEGWEYTFEFKYSYVGSGKAMVVSLEMVTFQTKTYTYASSPTDFVSGELDQSEAAEPYDANSPVYVPIDGEPQIASYLDKIYYKVDETDDDELDEFLADGKAIAKDGDGYYEVTMPRHSIKVEIKSKTRYAPIVIRGASSLAVTAYTFDSQNLAYVPATKAKHNQKVYFKVEEPSDGSATLRNLTLVYNSTGSSTTSYSSGLTLNDDGYYEGNNAKMTDMAFGLELDVAEKISFLNAAYIGEGARISGGSNKSAGKMTIDEYGELTYTTSDNSTSEYKYYFAPSDLNADGSFNVHNYTSANVYKLWTNNSGAYVFLDSTSTTPSLGSFYSFIAGKSALTAGWLLDASTIGNAKLAYGKLTSGTDNVTFGVDLTGAAPAVDYAVDSKISILNGASDVLTSGAVFDLTDGSGNVVATYKNSAASSSGYYVATTFVKGPSGTFAGTLGSIVTDGLSLTLDGVAPLDFAFASNNGAYTLSFLTLDADGNLKLTVASLDTTANTYAAIPGKAYNAQINGQYNGAILNASSKSFSSFYKAIFTAATTTDADTQVTTTSVYGQWEGSSTKYPLTLSGDGSISFYDHDFVFSADGETCLVSTGSSNYLLSRTITQYSSSSYMTQADGAIVDLATGGTLFELEPKTTTDGTRNNDVVYYDPTAGTLEFADVSVSSGAYWNEDGAVFTVAPYGGTSLGEFMMYEGNAIYNIAGTYQVGAETLVIANGQVTYDGGTYPFTIDSATQISFTTGYVEGANNLYTKADYVATIDVTGKTATVVKTVDTKLASTAYTAANPVVTKSGTDYQWSEDSASGTWTSPSSFSSANVDLTFTFTAAGTFSFDWAVSSEHNYDYFYVQLTRAGTTDYVTGYDKSAGKAAHSGVASTGATVSGTFSLAVQAGDVLTISYYKDGSGNKGTDNVILSNFLFLTEVPTTSDSGDSTDGSDSASDSTDSTEESTDETSGAQA